MRLKTGFFLAGSFSLDRIGRSEALAVLQHEATQFGAQGVATPRITAVQQAPDLDAVLAAFGARDVGDDEYEVTIGPPYRPYQDLWYLITAFARAGAEGSFITAADTIGAWTVWGGEAHDDDPHDDPLHGHTFVLYRHASNIVGSMVYACAWCGSSEDPRRMGGGRLDPCSAVPPALTKWRRAHSDR